MVSELAGEGAMPPQLPTPASHAELCVHLRRGVPELKRDSLVHLRQSVRRGPLLRRGVTELKEDLSIGVQSIVHQRWQHRRRRRPLKRNESRRCYHLRFSYRTRLGMLSKEFDSFKLERSEIGKQLDRFYEMLRSVAFTESTTRSLNSSNRELVNLLFTTFNRSSWSRSMESVGEIMSTVLINSTSVAIAVPRTYPWKARAQSSLILRLHNSIWSRSMKKDWSMWSRSINLRCYQVMFWRLFRFYAKSLMSMDSRSVRTRNKQSVVELDFELRLVSFYLSFFLKSKLGSEVNKSEIKSHRKSKIQNIGNDESYYCSVNRYKRFSKSGLAAHIATGPLSAPVNMSAFEKKNNETILVFDLGGGTFERAKRGFVSEEVTELKKLLHTEIKIRKAAEEETNKLKDQIMKFSEPELKGGNSDIVNLQKVLEEETRQKKRLEEEVNILKSQLSHLTLHAGQIRNSPDRDGNGSLLSVLDSLSPLRHLPYKDSNNGERGAITYLHGQVGLHKILSLLESEDACVQIHAVKVIANLAAEEANQEKIVEAGGLSSLLILLRSSEDETIRRVAAGALYLRKVDLRMYSAYQGHG
nr:armadillo repeat-containing kinesin-like protein 2 [Ipomoea batatas]